MFKFIFKQFNKNNKKNSRQLVNYLCFINFTKNGSYFMKKGKQRKQPLKYVS